MIPRNAEADPTFVELTDPPAAPQVATFARESALWLATTIVMTTIGILKGINLVIIMAYVMAGLWVVNYFLAGRSLFGLSARRPPRPPVFAGTPAEWPLEIRDVLGKGGWALEERVGDARNVWVALSSKPGRLVHPVARFTLPKRGRFLLKPLIARSGFPFGIVQRELVLKPEEELIVLPRPARVDGDKLRSWLLQAWAGRDDERRRVRIVVEREAEIHGLRDYRNGDSPRRIHWKATARRGKLIVREYEDAAPPRLLLVVEPWLPPKPTDDDRERLERLISLAAGVIREWRREAGAVLSLVVAGPNPIALDGPPGPDITVRQLELLGIETGGETGDFIRHFSNLSRSSRSSPVLLLSNHPQGIAASRLKAIMSRQIAEAGIDTPAAWYQFD